MANELSQNLKNDLFRFRNLLLIEYKRKIIWSILLYFSFLFTYKFTQTYFFFPVTALTPSAIDLFLKFDPRWTPMYLSLFIYLGFGTLSLPSRHDFFRFLFLFAGIFLTAISIFLFCPTFIERPAFPQNNFLYNILLKEDLPYNAFPSLHASFCIITCFLFFQHSKALRYKNFYRVCLILWGLLILFSILKIKQHLFIDLIGGIINAVFWIWLIYFVVAKNK